MTEERLWITIPKLFEIGYDIHGLTAQVVWEDLLHNRPKWEGWSSFDEGYTYADLIEICETFINSHSAIDASRKRVYTQLPIKTFFLHKTYDNDDMIIVRGAIWSNGMMWEEIKGAERNLNLLLDDLTIRSFGYENPSVTPEESIINLKKKVWEKVRKNDEDNEANIPENTKS